MMILRYDMENPSQNASLKGDTHKENMRYNVLSVLSAETIPQNSGVQS